MTDNNQQIDTVEKIENNDKLSGKRRALMKGAAAAVPVVLTMRSGAAFAAASTGSCISRDNKHAGDIKITTQPPRIISTAADGWVRRSGFCKSLVPLAGGSSEFKVYHFNNADPTKWQREANIFPEMDAPVGFNKQYNTVIDPVVIDNAILAGNVVNIGLMYEVGISGVLYNIEYEQECLLLVQIDDNTPLDLPPGSFTAGSAIINAEGELPYIMDSCWASVNPTGTNPII